MKAITETRLINTNTPIDEHTVNLWFGVMIQIDGFTEENMHDIQLNLEKLGYGSGFDLSPGNLKYVQDAIIDANRKGYYDDVAIWEHKLFRPQPILCDGDGPLYKLRQWYAQFYQDRV
jgi:3-ketosteroid 9alpha-monooxygenase subunit A